MNPLSIWIYYVRNKQHAAILLATGIMVTLGIYSLVALVWGVFVEPARQAIHAYSETSLVTPKTTNNGFDPSILLKLQVNTDIENVIPSTYIRIELPGMIPGQGFPFELLGLYEGDIAYFLERYSATIKTGRLPQSGAAELVLSEDTANILNVDVGDEYIVTSSEFYKGMEAPPAPTTFIVSGILDSNTELGIVSLEFLNHHEEYRQLADRFLVFAKEGKEVAVDEFLRSEIRNLETDVRTYQMLSERVINEAIPGLALLLPVVLLVAFAFSLVIATINKMANVQRLPEFGILHATGYSKRWLVHRLTMETTILTMAGWAVGIVLAGGVLQLVKTSLFAARGFVFNYVSWLPFTFSIPIILIIAGLTYWTTSKTFTRIDPVAIVEQRSMSQETDQKHSRDSIESQLKPLNPSIFYLRHPRRTLLLISTTGIMIMAIVLFVFSLSIGSDAKELFLDYLSHVSIVRSQGMANSLDSSVLALVKDHPTVERVIPYAPRYNILNVYIPPFASANGSPFGVYHDDLIYLVELYGLELKEGQLPHPGTNDMVISESLARNRDLKIGDVVGDPEQPAYPGAPSLDQEFVISGIFSQPVEPETGNGWGFISLEFLENQSAFNVPDIPPIFIVPKEGQKENLDNWLENELAQQNVSVVTYRKEIAQNKNTARQGMFSIALLEIGLAVVAAFGLTILNYVFTSERQMEFGVLYALGFGRHQILRRLLGETTYIIGIAWGINVLLFLAAIVGLLFGIFKPMGLTFSIFKFTPWLYTLPIPIAVLASSALTTLRMFSKLDAISIVDRRL
ncbi:MAG: ABC transporter permease [Anaerolineales bacterium]|nr:MAG: ABC transporter permease [Anaerolineales bacterium]